MATDTQRIQILEQQVASLQAQVAILLGEPGAAAATAFTAESASVAATTEATGTTGTTGTTAAPAAAVGLSQLTATLQQVLQTAQERPARATSPIAATLRSMDVELRAFVTMPQAGTTTQTGEVATSAVAEGPEAPTAAQAPGTADVLVSTPAVGQPVNAQALSVFRFSFATVPTPPGAAGGKVS